MNKRIQTRPDYPYIPMHAADADIDLRDVFDVLLDAKWLIAGIAAAVLLLAVLYAIFVAPTYQANVLLQVNENNAAYQPRPIGELAASLNRKSPPGDAEIAIMHSRYVVGQAVDKLGLTVRAKPDYLPLIGAFMARHYDDNTPAQPWLGFSSYAWGGDEIKVTRLNVPHDWLGQPLTLVAGAGDSYTLYSPEDKKLLTGQVGQPAYVRSPSGFSPSPSASSRSPSGKGEYPVSVKAGGEGDQIALFVSNLKARPGTRFTLSKLPRAQVIENLQKKLAISETGVGTNIVNMSLEWPRPRQLARILDALAAAYLRQNVNNNAQQARESLKFLRAQLPHLKAKLDGAQTALSQYQTKHQALDISADTKGLLDQMVNVQQQLSKLKLKETEMSGQFNNAYPGLQNVHAQLDRMRQIKARLDNRIKDIPQAQQAIFRLKRNVDVDSALYMSLLEQAQRLRVAQAGSVGDARIIDHALMPDSPVKPRKKLIAAFGLMLGLMLGTVVVFGRRFMRRGIDDPRTIERNFDLPVSAIVPRSGELIKARRHAVSRHQPYPVLARSAPDALAVEALRTLRTHIKFALVNAPNNVIALGSPTASTGKSFIIVNLAQLMANSGKRVLLIDADMRKGHLHRYFDADREPGLSQVLSGELDIDAAIHHNPNGADTLFCGVVSPSPSELLMHDRFAETVAAVSSRYDLVLLDTPPILAVTDGAIIAEQAGINLVVLRAGRHPERDIKLMLHHFEQSQITVQGIVFNDWAGRTRYRYEY